MMLAAGGGHDEVVTELLEAGLPWNAIDKEGHCAGDHAVLCGHQSTVDLLLDAGAAHASCQPLLSVSPCADAHACSPCAEDSDSRGSALRTVLSMTPPSQYYTYYHWGSSSPMIVCTAEHQNCSNDILSSKQLSRPHISPWSHIVIPHIGVRRAGGAGAGRTGQEAGGRA